MMTSRFLRISIALIMATILNITDTFGQCTPYLGQTQPTTILKRFPPSNYVSNSVWWWHGPPAFSPDGNEMFWVKYYADDSGTEIWFTKCENGQWSAAQKASFSAKGGFDNNPTFSTSNDTLYFYSGKPNGFIHYVTRIANGWSAAKPIIIPLRAKTFPGLQFAVLKDKTIYFELVDTSVSPNTDIYRTKLINGQYSQPENIGTPVNTTDGEMVGYVDPNERFMLYCSAKTSGYGYHDIYFSQRNSNGQWSNPINIGPSINGSFEDVAPYISPDEKYFFYNTWKSGDVGYNPYWKSAKFIYDMVTDVKEETSIPKEFKLEQNFPNPFNPSTVINWQLPMSSYVKLEIFNLIGEKIATLVDEFRTAGNHSYKLTVSDYSFTSGIYFYQLRASNFIGTKKLMVLK